ncbi:acyl-CoA dehydrogenase family protein [Marinobacter nanhaiticus D15-8W]|uniref:Isovaleryl-CoA dehydrogenase n=1 Tax=Marinobacter nanhaiticus D15-8W TaxID=626887 RepID=N6W613_9GAMM|nr:isovaleryl-CoA dehydrogenase [Marinobacter nanhaiticus]ENO15644.1 isovaleryl-CoA dehydrogenase [Marinobacter nanhaiticus D15-8W]BES73505.1 acyl-CoA dehydrogenase family protein [Marinobacter nanhaiticus D15-8W]
MNAANPSFQTRNDGQQDDAQSNTASQGVERYLATTHEVFNQPPVLENYNLFEQDQALREGTAREGAEWAQGELTAYGELTGRADIIELGFLANENKPAFHTHDRFGHRQDLVKFHPAYHQLMDMALTHGLHSSPWSDPGQGAHVARAAKYYMHSQVEAAHCCPVTMTFAAMPSIQKQPELAKIWAPKITARAYDPRNVPDSQKTAVTIGMAMTEKQGGSDVRANSTRAYPLGKGGPGEAYELVGHKWFVSAPMCDAFLVLAQAPGGLSCFLMPRWRPDGSKNPWQVQRLKNKMGNVANASSEAELRGALAWMVGDEGRGVPTIIEMVAMTRFDCMIGSSAGMRQAAAQALHHCRHREAFGARLNQQPLMQNVLADLALESEAALAMTLRVARALDNQDQQQERLFTRLATPVGKYWICKRTPNHAYEAMECIGGSGVMEDCIMPRLLRESPVNAIWEGSGNVQCLDTLRALQKSPDSLQAYFDEVGEARGSDPRLDRFVTQLQNDFTRTEDIQYRARNLVDRLALALQASLLVRHSPTAVADAFCASRLESHGGLNIGNLPPGTDAAGIIERATPVVD